MKALTPKSAICIEPSKPNKILPAFMSLFVFVFILKFKNNILFIKLTYEYDHYYENH